MKNNPKNPHKINSLIQKGQRYLQQGNAKKAESEFTKVLKLHADNFDALQSLGAVKLQLKDYAAAIHHLTKAISLNPDVPGLQCNLGLAYRLMNDSNNAKICFQRAIQIDPTFGAAHYNLALCHIDAGHTIEALTTLRNAEQCRPGHFGTLENIAYILDQLGDHAEAISYYKHALQIEPGNVSLLFSLGKSLQSNRAYQEAAGVYKKLLSLESTHCDARAKYADLLESINQPEEAKLNAEEVLIDQPEHELASLVLARIERRDKDFTVVKNRLMKVVNGKTDHPTDISAAIHTELGLALDRLTEYEAAFKAFQKANTIMGDLPTANTINKESAFTIIDKYEIWLSTRDSTNRSTFTINDGLPSPIFLTGFPRSGTTLTEQILAASPTINTGDELTTLHQLTINISEILGRNITYPEDLDTLSNDDVLKLRQHYWDGIKSFLGNNIISGTFVDKMPLNIIHLGLIERIFPDSKIIVALRDPRDVCLSCFMQLFQLNESMIQFLNIDNTAKYYSAVMGLWLKYRDTTSLQWIESRYEDIVADIGASAQKLNLFLGTESTDNAEDFYKQASKRAVSTPSYQDVGTPIYQRAKGRWEHYQEYMQAPLETLEPYIQAFGYTATKNK